MNIPILDLKREYQFLKKDIEKEIKQCYRTQHWILGEKVEEFEKSAADYLKIKYAIGVASGTDALVLSLTALSLQIKGKESFDKQDEIITTPFTFIATAEAVLRVGATPVFVDIQPDTFNIDPIEIKKAVNKHTVGIIPVHLYGLPANMGEIMKTAKENNLFVLEDVAQAFGAEYKSKKTGTLGTMAAFSFFPSKNLGGYGDGGLVTTNSMQLAQLIKVLRSHGQTKQYDADYLGYNSRLDSIQAAVLLAKLKKIDYLNGLRRKIAQKYNEILSEVENIQVPVEPQGFFPVYNLYTIRVNSGRNRLLEQLNKNGIGARIYYPVALHKMKVFHKAKVKYPLKNTGQSVNTVLSLPLHPFLKDKEINYVTQQLSENS